MEVGGEKYEYILVLNSDDEYMDVIFDIVKENLYGW